MGLNIRDIIPRKEIEISSLRNKLVGSTRNKQINIYEVSIGMGYRATYFIDGENYIWFWIGTHTSFDKEY